MPAVHPFAIAGFLSALAAAHATVAVCAAAIHARRAPAAAGQARRGGSAGAAPSPGDRALVAFALLNVALVGLDAGHAWAYAFGGEDVARLDAGVIVAEAGRIGAMAFLAHFVLQYARVPRSALTVAGLYGAASVLLVLRVTVGLGALKEATIDPTRFAGAWIPVLHVPANGIGTVSGLLMTAAAIVALTILVRAQMRGRREAISVGGMALLTAAIAYDALRDVGFATGPSAAPVGYALLVNGVIVTLLTRFTDLRGQLEARARELKDRSKDLARAYGDLRAAQDDLVRKEQLAAVGELSAVVAHEVRNPLAIITNAVATLRRSGLAEPDRETLLGILDEETSRLNRLVGDLLRYARPITLERQLVSMRELVERGMVLTKGKIGIDVDLVEDEPTEKIWADPNLLRQVIENLIDNAIQAMSTGGVLTVTLVNAEREQVRGVELQIQDTGEGMDTEVRARALDPFFTTRPSGTGLGLAIVARIVDAHGGSLRIRSQAGAGTGMHVFLPQGSEPAPRSRLHSDPGRRSSDPVLPAELVRALSGSR